MTSTNPPFPAWGLDVLAAPGGERPLRLDGQKLVDDAGKRLAEVVHGIVRVHLESVDPSIEYYRVIGGARLSERAAVPLAMTSPDTPVYHAYLERIAPAMADSLNV